MNILAMDTTTKKANVSLKINDTIYIDSIDNEITHSEKFLPLIDSILKKASSSLSCIDLYAVTTGPGSFTGVRIGLATVKAFAKVYNKNIFALNSLEVLAYPKIDTKISNQYIVSLMDAKNTRVYYTIYKVNIVSGIPTLENVIEYFNDTIDIASSKICEFFKSNNNVNIFVTGDIAERYSNIIKIDAVFSDTPLNPEIMLSIIENECKLNRNICESKYVRNYLSLDATYMRGSEAERTKYGEY